MGFMPGRMKMRHICGRLLSKHWEWPACRMLEAASIVSFVCFEGCLALQRSVHIQAFLAKEQRVTETQSFSYSSATPEGGAPNSGSICQNPNFEIL